MQLEEQAAGIAEDCARLIATPKRGGGGLAVLACGLLRLLIAVSCHGGHVVRFVGGAASGAARRKIK